MPRQPIKKKHLIWLAVTVIGLLGFSGYLVSRKPGPAREIIKDMFNRSATVQYVTDGDTIRIEDDVRVRLLGIDAPEKGECYYRESRDYLTELLEGKQVRLEKDITAKDRYDRLLRYVILPSGDERVDDLLVNDDLVRQGYARTYSIAPDNRYRDLFSSAQEEALRNNRGLWAECDYERENENLREQDTEPTDPACIIKGNISEKGYGKIYLIRGCDNYNLVKIDTRKGEQYFCTEEEAEDAGFRKATNCP